MTITLITACYNSVATIRTALESVLRQTWPELEYLVIDGGSTDGTVDILREYEKKFVSTFVRDCVSENADACADQEIRQSGNKALRQFIWVSEPDKGLYDALNKGIRMATGEVVGILNADDVLADDGVIERVASAFVVNSKPLAVNGKSLAVNRKPLTVSGEQSTENRKSGDDGQQLTVHGLRLTGVPDAVYGDISFVVGQNDSGLTELRNEATVRYYSAKHWRPWMLQWGFMPPHPSVYIRRECFERLGHYALDYVIAADYELLIRFLRKAKLRARYLPMCFVDMRVGGRSTKNWRSNLLLNREIVRGNREEGYFCCLPMLLPKYAFKVWEFAGPKLKRFTNG